MDRPAAESGLGSTYAGAMRILIATRYFPPERTAAPPRLGSKHALEFARVSRREDQVPVLERVLEESIGIGP